MEFLREGEGEGDKGAPFSRKIIIIEKK